MITINYPPPPALDAGSPRRFKAPALLGYDHDGQPIYRYSGGDSGYNTAGDALVTRTADGVDLNAIWAELKATIDIANSEQIKLASLLSYKTTLPAEAVPQSNSSGKFVEASEFGEPVAIRPPSDALLMGFDFRDFDVASRWTWRALRDMDSRQVQATHNEALAADSRLVNGSILRRLFDPTEGLNNEGHRIFGLWTGTDGLTPPSYLGRTFPQNTSHYLGTNAEQIDSDDIETLCRLVASKGFAEAGQLIILANPAEGEYIQQFRAGEPSRPNGPIAKWDFIPSASAPAYLQPENIVGQVAPAEFNGLKVAGSYSSAWLVESNYIPIGYVAVVATGGPDSTRNPIGVRQHPNTAYQGLRLLPGGQPGYPLVQALYSRSFGTGVRHRGAAAVAQVTTNPTYTKPVWTW
ncbi:hypothetical protein [Williamsia muralis]|uniref:Uncharacterized protein n=1 Tax=Williamsia marianensis TaxID=85044 RepID=A0ABU4EXM1_WILMA|nr:hypothetical protein [Williamsia muralis]MDV7135402.1 hypothetical protein [Williamsia muralis]